MRKWVVLAFLLLCQPMQAATYYIAPGVTGSDANPGTSGSPYKTFAYALAAARFAAGDTLILKDGTYTQTDNGTGANGRMINLRCDNGTNNNGTVALPMTVKAENERQAWLNTNGAGTILQTFNCSHWKFEGLRASGGENNGGEQFAQFFYVYQGNNITFKRNLLYNTNNYRNQGVISVENAQNVLLEENEAYSYHRSAFVFQTGTSNSTMRRNYAHSRSYDRSLLPGAYTDIDSTRGDYAYGLYPASSNILENNIGEDNYAGILLQAQGSVNSNQMLGNVMVDNLYGALSNTRDSTTFTPQNNTWKNNVVLNSGNIGFYIRTSYNSIMSNNTAYNSGTAGAQSGFNWDEESIGCTPSCSFTATNLLTFNNSGFGTSVTSQDSYSINYANSFNNTQGAWNPSTDANRTNSTTVDPLMGSYRIWIPASSPMKGSGLGAEDKGANVLYQYQNGVLTGTPLWVTSGGNLNNFTGCGVVVAGVNDVVGSSCTNADIRLCVGTANGCAFPSGYGDAGSSGGSWIATENFDSYTTGNDLNTGAGGSGWTTNWTQLTAAITVQDAPPGMSGKAAFINADPNFSYRRQFADLTAGIFKLKFKINTNTPADDIFVIVDEGTLSTAARGMVTIGTDGNVKIWDGTANFNVAPYSANTVHTITGEFNDTAQPNKFRAKLDSSNFSQWFPVANGGDYSAINGLRIEPRNTTLFNGQLYIDDIREGSTASVVSTIAVIDAGLAGAAMHVGEVLALQWSSTDLTGNIRLRISRDGGKTFQVIENAVPNTGTYNWTVTGPATTAAQVEVCGASNTSVCDTSATFGIGGTLLTIR